MGAEFRGTCCGGKAGSGGRRDSLLDGARAQHIAWHHDELNRLFAVPADPRRRVMIEQLADSV
ncbi:MAG: hypothetical protein CSA74_01050 [Rhodobacterales bacterium]|nr:MAG: hypothetical protein CSA74_01050 [Rhodobacterales bacterium]